MKNARIYSIEFCNFVELLHAYVKNYTNSQEYKD